MPESEGKGREPGLEGKGARDRPGLGSMARRPEPWGLSRGLVQGPGLKEVTSLETCMGGYMEVQLDIL